MTNESSMTFASMCEFLTPGEKKELAERLIAVLKKAATLDVEISPPHSSPSLPSFYFPLPPLQEPEALKDDPGYAFNISEPSRLDIPELLKGLSAEHPICVAELSALTQEDMVPRTWVVGISHRLCLKLLTCENCESYQGVFELPGWQDVPIPTHISVGSVFVTRSYADMKKVVGIFSKVRKARNPKFRKCQVRVTYP